MFLFKGYNSDTEEKYQKEFSDEYEATSFATDNAFRFPKFEVINLETNDIVFDDKESADNEATAMDGMFPDEDSEAGFDWTLGE
ncbi:MAG TPA: hypothetical protein VK666_16725 [Chryseolinea sp.]|nr:hypothetical protein [Chryseolinea sp.]